VPPSDGRIASNGGDGGRGFPGETLVVSLGGLSIGDRFEIVIGQGGDGGRGGEGFETGKVGSGGADGWVVLVPLHTRDKEND
jgi:hypothetical protein